MSKSLFDSLNNFIRKRHRLIIIVWVVVVLLSLILIPSFFSAVSYDLTGGFGSRSDTESDRASKIIDAQFHISSNGTRNSSNSENNSIIVVLQGVPVYSDALKQKVLTLNDTLSKNAGISNYTGQTSLYTLENSLLNSSLSDLINQTASLQSNIITINSGLFTLRDNLSVLSENLFGLQTGINQTAQLVFGVPSAFVGVWQGITAQGVTDPIIANIQANVTLYVLTSNFGGDAQSIGYYTAFYNAWANSFQALPNDISIADREAFAIGQSVLGFLNNPQIDSQTKQMIGLVASGLNVNTWNRPAAITNLTVTTIASSIPEEFSTALGASPLIVVNRLYGFGESPSNAILGSYAISLLENSYSNLTSSDVGFSISNLLGASYQLGVSPNISKTWKLASDFISNATQSNLSDSPLFTINATSLSNFISEISPNSTTADLNLAIADLIATQSYVNYPFIPSNALTGNFVNSKNDSMLIILVFSSETNQNTIAQVESDVQNSGLQDFGAVYVTGGSVLSRDVEKAFLPALEVTAGPGIAISLLIVGLLFMAPVAALIPVILGGISVSVSLAAIYISVVEVGHSTLTFLTPTLTILLMLGLAVDYAVLQLKRTREERQKGKSIEECVAISLKWAGQAVLTAGLTVIVAYIVMAVANVPIFSDVGIAIALGVSILLFASLTLLPALEIALGDKIFWPGLKKLAKKSDPNKNVLKRLAQGTLKHKVPVVIIISLLSLGAFFVVANTPTSEDFLSLIPKFQSNQGLTVIAESFGTGTIEPTQIVLITTSQVTYGNNQFNQTLLNQIEQITDTAAESKGVATVSSPTRPFGNAFNYSSIETMPELLRLQYQSQMFSMIGQDNKTVVINVGFSNSAFSQSALDSLQKMEKNINELPDLSGLTIYFGGATPSAYESHSFMTSLIPQVVIILSAAVFVILFFQLRSAFTPIRLIITILCSVVFSLAIISAIFYFDMNLPILDFAPLFVVVTMLGVGIDYDIFFLTRIREEVLNGKTDNEAIITAIDKVWVTILCLGLVLATVFASLILTNIPILQEISLAVAAAVMIDVSVIILFFVPALMGLAQKYNWWPYKIVRNKKIKNELE